MTKGENVASEPESNQIRHTDFAERFTKVVDSHPLVPAVNFGRLQWLANRLEQFGGPKLYPETIRRWFSGQSRPRPAVLTIIAEMLDVDEAWLAVGTGAAVDARQRRLRNLMVDGVVNVVAGLIQMDGSHPAFPSEGKLGPVDIHVIIKGAKYDIHVALGTALDGDRFQFTVPADNGDLMVLGVVPTEGFGFDILELDGDLLTQSGVAKSRQVTLDLDYTDGDYQAAGKTVRKITSFAERL